MQYRIILNKFTGSWVFSALMVMNAAVIADSYTSQQYPMYSQQYNTDQSAKRRTNPWLLPQSQGRSTEFQQAPDYRNRSYQQGHQDTERQLERLPGSAGQGFRFVTPEILQSLKQQQTQHQLMPENALRQRRTQSQSLPGAYGNSAYGMGYSAPIYGMPGISPWGGDSALLYQGQSSPWVPNEAIGGLSPIPVPLYQDSDMTGAQDNYDVFSPFSLLPGENQ